MERKDLKRITTKSVLLSFALALNIGIAGASAQKRATKKRQQSGSSSSAANKSRPRRIVVANRSGESTPSPADESTPAKAAGHVNESSGKPAVGSSTAEESIEKAETNSIKDSGNSEKPGEAETPSVLPDETKGADTPNVSMSLRGQIEAAPGGPERIRLQLRLAEQLSATGQKAEATTELHAITKSDVFDPQGFYNAGNALARLGDSDEAINAYRKAIDQRKGRYSRALNNLGVVLLRAGRWDEAYDAFLSALKLESFHYAEASYNLGRVYSARGERDLAIREWRRALSVDPDHTAAARALAGGEARIVIRTESSTKAPSPTKTVKGEHPVRSTAAAGNTESIRTARNSKATKVLALDAVSYDFLQRARNLRERGKLQEAAENYERVISRSRGYFAPANLELSYVLMTLKRPDEALANLLQVMNRDGARYPISYYYLGRLYEFKGDLRSAEESFAEAAMAYKTENNSFLLDLSRVRERQGNFKGALAAMEEYVAAMEQHGLKPSWADDGLSVLRQKSIGAQVQPK
jgi:tetratricopeptide (TPR) repeat protein